MIHPADDLWSHITRRPTSLLRVIFLLFSSYPEISDPEVPIFLKHQILRLEISMYNPFRVDKLKSIYDTSHYEL